MLMQNERPRVLVIGGMDPSGAAGVLADVKTLEHFGVLAQVIVSAETVQNDNSFEEVGMPNQEAYSQLRLLLERSQFNVVKIGMIPNFEWALPLLDLIKESNPEVFVIWDPILKASFARDKMEWSGQLDFLGEWMYLVDLITPNLEEAPMFENIYGKFETWNQKAEDSGAQPFQLPSVLLKGGHSPELETADNLNGIETSINSEGKTSPNPSPKSQKITDTLYHQGQIQSFTQDKTQGFQKRGTGCVLASLIASQMVKKHSVADSCEWAQTQMEKYLKSSSSFIGTWAPQYNEALKENS